MSRDEHGISHDAVNWRGNLADLSVTELRERAESLAWWIASRIASDRPTTSAGVLVDPVADFRAARDAYIDRSVPSSSRTEQESAAGER